MAAYSSHREPCPDRIIDDAGNGFAIGAVIGTLLYFTKGIKSSPRGELFAGGLQSTRMNAGKMAGRFGAWCSVFSVSDCALVYLWQKEDPWNSIIAGATSAGLLSIRQGLRRASGSALGAAALFALMEGFGIVLGKYMPNTIIEDPNRMPPETSGSGQSTPPESFHNPTPMPNLEFK